ncbi:MAG: Fumarate hydratase class II [Verrucomicrobiae bacterium]|nr:Fumarate hydratase class II [Verrucomicrobiae bacterium]
MLYGAQTRRALADYQISGWPVPPRLIQAIAQIIRDSTGGSTLADEVIAGKHAAEFPVDVFQDRDGAATVANVCEVIGVPVEQVNPREVFAAAIRLSVHRVLRDELRIEVPVGTFSETSAALKVVADQLPERHRQLRRWIAGADVTIQLCDQDGDLPVLGVLLLESALLLAAAIRGKGEA